MILKITIVRPACVQRVQSGAGITGLSSNGAIPNIGVEISTERSKAAVSESKIKLAAQIAKPNVAMSKGT
jgi:hypothetical protein